MAGPAATIGPEYCRRKRLPRFSEASRLRSLPMRGGAVWQLVGLITRRSQVQILPPLPNEKMAPFQGGHFRLAMSRIGFCEAGLSETIFPVAAGNWKDLRSNSCRGKHSFFRPNPAPATKFENPLICQDWRVFYGRPSGYSPSELRSPGSACLFQGRRSQVFSETIFPAAVRQLERYSVELMPGKACFSGPNPCLLDVSKYLLFPASCPRFDPATFDTAVLARS